MQVNGLDMIAATIYEPSCGNWHAVAEVDTPEPLTGAIAITVQGVTFLGTVYRGGMESDRWVGRIVGGSGGLYRSLPARAYHSCSLGSVLADALRDAGETLDGSSADYASHTVPHWQRAQHAAGLEFSQIADHVGDRWRISRAGSVVFEPNTFRAFEMATTKIDEDTSTGSIVYAPEADDLIPAGCVFGGQNVGYVLTAIERGSIRQHVRIAS